MPSLEQLGTDLLHVTTAERVLSIARPLVCFAGYFVFASLGWWVAAVVALAGLMFITYVSTSHDLLHRTLGFSRGVNDVLLSVIEALVLRSGHAFRLTHLHHHRRFPHDDDVEGAVVRLPWWRALLTGMGHQTQLFRWAWSRASAAERKWMATEAAWVMACIVVSVLAARVTMIPLVYVVLVVTSSWLYPFATVWVPHHSPGETAVTQTIAVRGRWVPELFLQHTYHLEHHLYPAVPSHRWPELARRLDPWLRAHGARVMQIP
jgi:beta-carotene hydroxylase